MLMCMCAVDSYLKVVKVKRLCVMCVLCIPLLFIY